MAAMSSGEVLQIRRAAGAAGVRFWIDGGWCVDALVGRQTRAHDDLDVAVDRDDLDEFVTALTGLGYRRVASADATAWNFVMRSDRGCSVDVHVFHFDDDGVHDYGIAYPAGSLRGVGVIDGCRVHCIAAESMYVFKTSYEPAPKDRADIDHLAKLLDP